MLVSGLAEGVTPVIAVDAPYRAGARAATEERQGSQCEQAAASPGTADPLMTVLQERDNLICK